MKIRSARTILRLTLPPLLATLLLCGCAGKQNDTEIPSVPYEEVEQITGLVCYLTSSDTEETQILTGDTVYSLYRMVNTAMAKSSFNPNDPPPAPTDEPYVYAVFYVECDETAPAETGEYGYLLNAAKHYGAFTVYESGYARFSLSPVHSHSYSYCIEESTYGFLHACLTTPTLEELNDFTCTFTRAEETWTVDGEDAKELYRALIQGLRETTPDPDKLSELSVRLAFHTNDIEGIQGFYGSYSLYENGYVVYSPAPSVSMVYYYEIDGSVYEEIMERWADMQPSDTHQ